MAVVGTGEITSISLRGTQWSKKTDITCIQISAMLWT